VLVNQEMRRYDINRGKAKDALLDKLISCNHGGTLHLGEVLAQRLLRVAEEAALA